MLECGICDVSGAGRADEFLFFFLVFEERAGKVPFAAHPHGAVRRALKELPAQAMRCLSKPWRSLFGEEFADS